MTISYGANLGLLENAATGEAHDTALRGLLRGLDGLIQANVKGYLTNTPPGSPANGDCYIIGAAPTGAWAGKGGKVTRYSTVAAAWEFYTPKNGWMLQANTAREIYRYTASAWEIYYQEGTWTPTLAGSSTPGSHTYSQRSGLYRRLASVVQYSLRVALTAKDASMSGSVSITGLPLNQYGVGNPCTVMASSLAAGVSTTVFGYAYISKVEIYKNAPNASFANLDSSDITNSSDIIVSGVYQF